MLVRPGERTSALAARWQIRSLQQIARLDERTRLAELSAIRAVAICGACGCHSAGYSQRAPHGGMGRARRIYAGRMNLDGHSQPCNGSRRTRSVGQCSGREC